ncbi:MAG: hypothetical protein LBF34_03195 [Puniceicoccales bacterium]|jgi:serine/threonine protein kinase|nr:hypothetical protein [Puniceicoccales bacterium]
MNKKQIINKGKKSIASIAFLGLSLNLHGEVLSSQVPPECLLPRQIAQNKEEFNFLWAVLGLPLSSPSFGEEGILVELNTESRIGEGSFSRVIGGRVIGGAFGDIDIVDKIPCEGKKEYLIKECSNNLKLLESITNVFRASKSALEQVPVELDAMAAKVGELRRDLGEDALERFVEARKAARLEELRYSQEELTGNPEVISDQEIAILEELMGGLEAAILEEFIKDPEEYRRVRIANAKIQQRTWEGMKSLICSFGVIENEHLLQRMAMGFNLFNAVVRGHEFECESYLNGYPRSRHEAIRRASDFFYTLATLHDLGYIFVDISSANIILENAGPEVPFEDVNWISEPFTRYPCRLIDFGTLTEIGGRIPNYMLFQSPEKLPPEYHYAWKVVPKIEAKDEEIERVVSQMKAIEFRGDCGDIVRDSPVLKTIFHCVLRPLTFGFLQVPTDERMAELVEEYVELNAQKERLEQEKENLYRKQTDRMPPAHPSYDIHQSVPVLEIMLFGQSRVEGHRLFSNELEIVMRNMYNATGKIYPPEILARISEIIEAMRNPDPRLRPSAMNVADALREIANSEW